MSQWFHGKKEVRVGWAADFVSEGMMKGPVSDAFVDKLWELLHYPTEDRLLEVCYICHPLDSLRVSNPDRRIKMFRSRHGQYPSMWGGSFEVPGSCGIVYWAPCMIYHYVVDHGYHPPEEFIQAVMIAPVSCG